MFSNVNLQLLKSSGKVSSKVCSKVCSKVTSHQVAGGVPVLVGEREPQVSCTVSMPVSLSSSVTSIPGTRSLGAVTGIMPVSAVTASLGRSASLHSKPAVTCPLESGESDTIMSRSSTSIHTGQPQNVEKLSALLVLLFKTLIDNWLVGFWFISVLNCHLFSSSFLQLNFILPGPAGVNGGAGGGGGGGGGGIPVILRCSEDGRVEVSAKAESLQATSRSQSPLALKVRPDWQEGRGDNQEYVAAKLAPEQSMQHCQLP